MQMKRQLLAICAVLMLSGCGVSDPALRQGIAAVDRRPELARVQLRPFAEQGNDAAIAPICIAYGRSMDSRVRSPEREQAFAWCQHAAAAGNTEAQYHLGNFYAWGIGTAENRELALHWYSEAARHGHNAAEDAKRGLEGKSAVCRNLITGCRLF